jgi:hypothetical protein
MLVAMLVTVTVAPGMTAPEASRTVPEMAPRVICANAVVGSRTASARAEAQRAAPSRLNLIVGPPKLSGAWGLGSLRTEARHAQRQVKNDARKRAIPGPNRLYPGTRRRSCNFRDKRLNCASQVLHRVNETAVETKIMNDRIQ